MNKTLGAESRADATLQTLASLFWGKVHDTH